MGLCSGGAGDACRGGRVCWSTALERHLGRSGGATSMLAVVCRRMLRSGTCRRKSTCGSFSASQKRHSFENCSRTERLTCPGRLSLYSFTMATRPFNVGHFHNPTITTAAPNSNEPSSIVGCWPAGCASGSRKRRARAYLERKLYSTSSAAEKECTVWSMLCSSARSSAEKRSRISLSAA